MNLVMQWSGGKQSSRHSGCLNIAPDSAVASLASQSQSHSALPRLLTPHWGSLSSEYLDVSPDCLIEDASSALSIISLIVSRPRLTVKVAKKAFIKVLLLRDVLLVARSSEWSDGWNMMVRWELGSHHYWTSSELESCPQKAPHKAWLSEHLLVLCIMVARSEMTIFDESSVHLPSLVILMCS